MGENPINQISNAEITGIHMLYRFIFAAFAMLKVGAAISATTPGRIPMKIRWTISLSSNCWKKRAMAKIMMKEGRTVPRDMESAPLNLLNR